MTQEELLTELRSGTINIDDESLQLIDKYTAEKVLEARVSESTAAWQESCNLPSANSISRSLAGRKQHLEAELSKLKERE